MIKRVTPMSSKQNVTADKRITDMISTQTLPALSALTFACMLTGGFSEWYSCLIAVVTSVLLLAAIVKNKKMYFRLDIISCAVLLILAGYIASCFYAVDAGAAVTGAVKFLPAALYMLLLEQYPESKKEIRDFLPYLCLALGVLSLALMLMPSSRLSVEGRLAGFFEYPNTFAMFLLIGELVCISKEKLKALDIIIAAALFLLIIATMSRAVFALALAANFLLLFIKKGKTHKIILGAIAASIIAAFLIFSTALKDNSVFGRLFSVSIYESTFAGRLLYWQDALPLILKHPFGLGYLGYYYTEQSVQTGVYAVRYIHNDLLQLLLDIGWLPALGFIAALVASFASKRLSAAQKIILSVFFLHILFDFDLQFSAMYFILLLFLDSSKGKDTVITASRGYPLALIGISGIVCAYFAVALGLSYYGELSASYSLYSADTHVKTELMIQESDIDKQNVWADDILSSNDNIAIAYSVKARKAYSEGDFTSLIEYKNRIFEIAPFDYDEYEEYAYMLINGIELYSDSGDSQSAEICRQELLRVEEKLNSLNDRLSSLGKMIVDQPTTSFPPELTQTIEGYRLSQ